MATTKKYISLDKLTKYHGRLIQEVDAKDQSILSQAQSYADGLAENYDAAGAAAAVQANLDKEVSRAQGKEAEALAAAQAAQKSANDLGTLVGTLPEGTSATSVVDYVNVKTAGIATDAALAELQGQVSGAQEAIDAIEADYLKSSDKTEVLEAVAAEENRAKGVEGGLETRLKAVEDDYLKGSDKTELQGVINDNKAILDAVKEDVDAFFKDADMTESAKDTLKELQTYIASDESGAAAMAESIQKNKDDIAGVSGRVTTLEETSATLVTDLDSAEERIAALEGAVGEGGDVATQISTAVKAEEDARKAAITALEGTVTANKAAADKTAEDLDALSDVVDTKAAQADLTALTTRVSTAEGEIDALQSDMSTAKGNISTLQSDLDAAEEKVAANEAAIATNTAAIATKAAQSALEAEISRATAAENANKALIDAFVEASEEEVLAIFNA